MLARKSAISPENRVVHTKLDWTGFRITSGAVIPAYKVRGLEIWPLEALIRYKGKR